MKSRNPFFLHPFFIAALFYSVLSVLMTWPLAAHLGSAVVGWEGDNLYFVWLVGWFQKALLELHQLRLAVPLFNYPQGWNLAYNEITPAMALIALPFSLLGGPVLGYNVAILVSFVLSLLSGAPEQAKTAPRSGCWH